MYVPADASINSEDKFAILVKGIEANFPPTVKIVGHSILKFLFPHVRLLILKYG